MLECTQILMMFWFKCVDYFTMDTMRMEKFVTQCNNNKTKKIKNKIVFMFWMYDVIMMSDMKV